MHNETRSWITACGLALTLAAAGAAAQAAPPLPPGAAPAAEGIVSLASAATVEVPKDWMSVAFSVTREGADANTVQAQLKAALDAALAEARRAAKPAGQVDVQTGMFSLQPRYTAKGLINGWVGSTELLVEGRDLAGIAQLVGRINTMTVARLGYSLSRDAREKVEGEVAAQAIARFRAKAADYAKQFGYERFAIREVNVQTDMPSPPVRGYLAKGMLASAATDDALPVEAGKGTVTATVNGTVQLAH